jgi:hypothetical protein
MIHAPQQQVLTDNGRRGPEHVVQLVGGEDLELRARRQDDRHAILTQEEDLAVVAPGRGGEAVWPRESAGRSSASGTQPWRTGKRARIAWEPLARPRSGQIVLRASGAVVAFLAVGGRRAFPSPHSRPSDTNSHGPGHRRTRFAARGPPSTLTWVFAGATMPWCTVLDDW